MQAVESSAHPALCSQLVATRFPRSRGSSLLLSRPSSARLAHLDKEVWERGVSFSLPTEQLPHPYGNAAQSLQGLSLDLSARRPLPGWISEFFSLNTKTRPVSRNLPMSVLVSSLCMRIRMLTVALSAVVVVGSLSRKKKKNVAVNHSSPGFCS